MNKNMLQARIAASMRQHIIRNIGSLFVSCDCNETELLRINEKY